MNASNDEKHERVQAIFKRQHEEVIYWVNEWINGCQSPSVSVNTIEAGDGYSFAIVTDHTDGSSVLIQTDSTAPSVEESHKWMILDAPVLAKLAEIHASIKKP